MQANTVARPAEAVARRYSRWRYPLRILNYVPRSYRVEAAQIAAFKKGADVIEFGSGWGTNIAILAELVGRWGTVEGVEVSRELADYSWERVKHFENVSIDHSDMFVYEIPDKVDSFFFSFSYCVMKPPEGDRVDFLRKLREHLRPGGRIVIFDAGLPSPRWRWQLPFWKWVMEHSLLGDPYVNPRLDMALAFGETNVQEKRLGMSHFVVWVEKPV